MPMHRGKSGLHGNTVPGNARRSRFAGIRESATESRPPTVRRRAGARVKGCGKSAPRDRQRKRHGKPHREQDRIGTAHGEFRPAVRVDCLSPHANAGLEEWSPIARTSLRGKGRVDRTRLTGPLAPSPQVGSAALNRGTTLRSPSVDASHRRSFGLLRPLPHPATQMMLPLGGRVGGRAGAAAAHAALRRSLISSLSISASRKASSRLWPALRRGSQWVW
jgi:hypothetical protein